jgi:uncharacterized protein YjeT (DUF2065 family)
MEDALKLILTLSEDRRRTIGLVALALGVVLVWLSGPAWP